ncbi:MAG: hypothetical protein K1X57_21165 [Gemmataceae bacterium]|nr:hypothetical protein [Gemmataceae bacterium]
MNSWRTVWRVGFAPGYSDAGLDALRTGLLADDPDLLQGATTQPEPVQACLDWPAEGACPIVYGAWKGDGLQTVGALEECFARSCFEADMRLGEPAGSRWLLNWIDDTPRETVRRVLLAEVDRELERRAHADRWECDESWDDRLAAVAA